MTAAAVDEEGRKLRDALSSLEQMTHDKLIQLKRHIRSIKIASRGIRAESRGEEFDEDAARNEMPTLPDR